MSNFPSMGTEQKSYGLKGALKRHAFFKTLFAKMGGERVANPEQLLIVLDLGGSVVLLLSVA